MTAPVLSGLSAPAPSRAHQSTGITDHTVSARGPLRVQAARVDAVCALRSPSTGVTIQSHLVLVSAARWQPRLTSAPLAVHAGRRSPVQRTHGTPRPRVPAPTRSREFVRGDTPRFSGTQEAHANATRDTPHPPPRPPHARRSQFLSHRYLSSARQGLPEAHRHPPPAHHTPHIVPAPTVKMVTPSGRTSQPSSARPPSSISTSTSTSSAPPPPPPSAAKPTSPSTPAPHARPAPRAPAPIQTLPAELLEHVLLLAAPASPAAPAALARTCRAFAALVYAAPDQHLWRGLFLRAWDDPRALSGEGSARSREGAGAGAGIDWGREYRRRVAAQRWFASARADRAGAGTMGARDVARAADALEALVAALLAAPPCAARDQNHDHHHDQDQDQDRGGERERGDGAGWGRSRSSRGCS
ncbi:hypothetical protein POSPLADRAFT_1063500 [Postia placenta MAD-698-R-SB12]|uniref:F-box domain-containing protein n=1 Tax=Postia placenta MAD-698-R-SB12 TaxID=670580 RepID=A0A1X6MHW7_9APHY|nr:hypothetical protein POSPLADRAFT_1063500 [Postia placenta MAD-698-R-SB12]OSX55802.1 hypothetical protein POSPLADRAFT_1063500 [Postia placenta MAD-698-R-SB12]